MRREIEMAEAIDAEVERELAEDEAREPHTPEEWAEWARWDDDDSDVGWHRA